MPRPYQIFQRYSRDKSGATAVEAALVMPIVLMVIFSLFHVAIFFFSTHQAQRASEQAGRDVRMMNQPSQQEILSTLEARMKNPLGGDYTTTVAKIDEHGGTFADIRISYAYVLPIPFLDRHTFRSESGTRVLLRDMAN